MIDRLRLAAAVRVLALLVAAVAVVALQPVHAQEQKRGFLFEIRKGAQVSLLFGTIHVGRPEFYPLPPSRQSHLAGFDALVLEADITDTRRTTSATEKFALYAPGVDGLDRRLPPALLKRIDALLERNRLDRTPMLRMKPWMLGTVLSLFEAAQAGYVPGLAAESYMIRLAQAQSRPILELEGIEHQFGLFESAPWATQVAFLEEALRAVETNAARREINRIVQAWETADLRALERLLAEMRGQTSVGARFTVDTILLGRHDAMVDRIASMMADGRKYVFAVGALHVAGPRGLVELLKARGYTVTEL